MQRWTIATELLGRAYPRVAAKARTHTAECFDGIRWQTIIATTTPSDYGSRPSPGRPGERPCAVILAARFARALRLTLSLSHEEGAGKTGWPLHPGLSRRKKLRKRESTGTGGDHTGLPCAMVLRLIRALPGEPCRLPPSAAMRLRIVGISASLWGARTTRFRRPRPRRSSTGTSASTASPPRVS